MFNGLLLLFIYVKTNVQDVQAVQEDHQVNNPCSGFPLSSTIKLNPVVGQTTEVITCACPLIKGGFIDWFDENCKEVELNDHVTVKNQSLIISELYNSSTFYCTNNYNCTYKVTVSVQMVMKEFFQSLKIGIIVFDVICVVIIGTLLWNRVRDKNKSKKSGFSTLPSYSEDGLI